MSLNLSGQTTKILQGIGGFLIGAAMLILAIYTGIKYSKKSSVKPIGVDIIPFVPDKNFKWIMLAVCILCLGGIIMVSLATQESPIMGPSYAISGGNVTVTNPVESFGNEPQQVTYQTIGFGPLVSTDNITKWLSGKLPGDSEPGTTNWLDGNGFQIELPSPAFKSIYGFIPPSFEYFPDGQNTNDYSPKNYKEGRQKCMEACTLTNCTAVQTEVAQNCYHQTVPIAEPTGEGGTPTQGEYTNNCMGSSSHACTLFYNNIDDADDAYWQINETFGNGNTNGCLGINKDGEPYIGCLGKKYYEDTGLGLPSISPDGLKPSESTVKWCDETIAPTGSGYEALPGLTCSCTDEVNCNDPGCCKWRNIITTEHLSTSKPYYNLPMAVETLEEDQFTGQTLPKVLSSINKHSDGSQSCCGMCDGNPVSCYPDKCESSIDTNCWFVDEPCSGNLYTKDQAANDAFNAFTQDFNPNDRDFSSLLTSCYYRQQAAISSVQQYNCPTNTPERGCFGSPPVISISKLEGSAGACSNDSIIPESSRCKLPKDADGRPINTGVCEGFPYACGTQDGSNRLWIPISI